MIKMPKYAQWDVPWFWLLDPLQQTIEAYENINLRWTLHATFGDEHDAGIAPFDAASIDLTRLWL